MSEWRPIDTAPKDGTVILGVRFLEYLGDSQPFADGATMQWEGGSIFKGGWAYTGHTVSVVADQHQPTHWMPLPPPLADTEGPTP